MLATEGYRFLYPLLRIHGTCTCQEWFDSLQDWFIMAFILCDRHVVGACIADRNMPSKELQSSSLSQPVVPATMHLIPGSLHR